jgi:hypothetical protein
MGNFEHDGGRLMNDRPKGDELLATARKVLREELLPLVTKENKRDVLMVMNAMSIAERQLGFCNPDDREQIKGLENLMEKSFSNAASASRVLAHFIREGGADPGQVKRNETLAWLRANVRRKLMESNPKILAD